MTLLRRRAKSRSCILHGDNGCEIQGEAGPRERAQDAREWRGEVDEELRGHLSLHRPMHVEDFWPD